METGAIPGVSVGRRLAVGGMAEVHLAERAEGGGTAPCVVKRLLPRSSAEARALFAREATALAALTAKGARHVVPLIDAGPDRVAPEWLVLGYVDGVELGALLDWRRRRGRPLPLGAALAVADGLTAALVELAEAETEGDGRLGLVHQDLHPGNLLVGPDGQVTVIDLGVASFSALGRTSADPRGTVAWMAPEQLRGGAVTPATDIYAAGLVLWEAFTGQPPRPEADGSLAALLAHRAALPPPPSRVRAELPEVVDALILAALAPDPEARPTATAWRDGWRAVGDSVAADAAALGRLAAAAREAAADVRAQRTLAPSRSGGGVGHTQAGATETTADPTAPAAVGAGRRRAWFRGAAVALAVGGPLLWVGLRAGGAEAPTPGLEGVSPDGDTVAETASPAAVAERDRPVEPSKDSGVRERAAREEPDAVDSAADAGEAARAGPTPTADILAPETDRDTAASRVGDTPSPAAAERGPTPRPESGAGAETPARDVAPPAPGPTRPDGRPRASATPREVPAPQAAAVEVRPAGGPVHVDAGGRRGLAPQRSDALGPGDHTLLRLTGASPAFSVLVRARRDAGSDAVSATIGAPAGELHRVQCGDRPETPTPTLGVPIPPAGITCRFTAADGRTFGARLGDTRR